MKKKMIYAAAVILCLVMMCSCMTGCSTKADVDFKMKGVCMTPEEFTAFFKGEKTLEECTTGECELAVSNLDIHGDEISMYMTQVRGKLYQMSSMLGRLFADKTRTAAGEDATVAFLMDTLNSSEVYGISVVLFQICNGTEEDDELLFNKELSGQPHLRLYTADDDDVLYFYEIPLPEKLKDVHSDGLEAVDNYDKWYENLMQNGGDIEIEG